MSDIIPDNWYENFFHGINCEIWEKVISPEWTDAEVNFLIDELQIKSGDHVLDIPCGAGRHSIELARRGLNLTGIDISKEFVAKLREKVKRENLPIQVLRENILKVKINGPFGGAYCLGNSFGYFDMEGVKTFVAKVSACLRAGGRFVINSGLVAESILPHIPQGETYTVGDITMTINNVYVADKGYMVSHLQYTRGGKSEDHSFKHYVFTLSEIIRLLESVGLKTLAVYNSTNKQPYQVGDQQLYLVAEKK